MNIGICIIAYNRINSLKRVLKSIESAFYGKDSIPLIISIDKSNTNLVEEYAKKYKWKFGEKKVITYSKNLGLRKHVLKCGELLKEFDALIVLEDDISIVPSFYYYAKQCVEKYQYDDKIAGISLYNFPLNYQNLLPFHPLQTDSDIYLMQCAQSWGQIWMKKQWFAFKDWYDNNSEEFDELGHLPKTICNWPKSSWLKYHIRYCIEKNKYFVYPYISLSTNNADEGTHYSKRTTLFQSQLLYGIKKTYNLNPTICYDGYFENEIIYQIIGLNKDNLCLDFYGEKNNRMCKRYWLTRKQLPYKILKSYSLSLKPYEWNIINNIKGNELYLYDTNNIEKNTIKPSVRLFNIYMYNIDISLTQFFKRLAKTAIKRCLHL